MLDTGANKLELKHLPTVDDNWAVLARSSKLLTELARQNLPFI